MHRPAIDFEMNVIVFDPHKRYVCRIPRLYRRTPKRQGLLHFLAVWCDYTFLQMKSFRAHGKCRSRVHQLSFEVADNLKTSLPRHARSIVRYCWNCWRRRLSARLLTVCRRRGRTPALNGIDCLSANQEATKQQGQSKKGRTPNMQHATPRGLSSLYAMERRAAGLPQIACLQLAIGETRRSRARAFYTAGTWS